MNPLLATYIGFIVAVGILLWGVIEIFRRQYGRKKMNSSAMNTWVPLKPTSMDMHDDLLSDEDHDDQPDMNAKAQQNGHYSESKKKL
ncbi:MAG TPA: hypothetical protein VFB12_14970 [Ktedonobacteraceae bacterium]|nr:hypothetical protein [Ktedonobacteraceae bacterium]